MSHHATTILVVGEISPWSYARFSLFDPPPRDSTLRRLRDFIFPWRRKIASRHEDRIRYLGWARADRQSAQKKYREALSQCDRELELIERALWLCTCRETNQ